MHQRRWPLVAFVALLCASAALADNTNVHAGTEAQAKVLFDEGKTLFAEGKYGAACERLDASYKLNRLSSTRGLLAACYEKIGKLASAWVAYREAAALAEKQNNAERAQAARDKATELEPKLAWLTVDASAAVMALPAIRIEIDGVEIPHAALASPIPVDGGQHFIEAKAIDYKRWTTTVDIQDTEKQKVTIPPLVEDTTQKVLLQQRIAEDRKSVRRRRMIAYGLIGGGTVSVLVATTLGVLAYNQWSDAKDAGCNDDGRCLIPADADKVDSAAFKADLATYIGGAGLALVGAGLIVYFTAPKPKPEAELRVTPSMGNGAAGFVLEGRF